MKHYKSNGLCRYEISSDGWIGKGIKGLTYFTSSQRKANNNGTD